MTDWIWFSGIWILLLSGPIGWVTADMHRLSHNFSIILQGSEPGFSAGEIRAGIMIAVVPVLIVTCVHAVQKKYFGRTDFYPSINKDPVTVSKDKKRAMHPPIPREYLSNKPDGFTIGKYGRQYVRIPQYPIRNALVIGPPGTGKTSGPLLIPEIWNFQNSTSKDRMVIFAPDVKPEHQLKSVLFDHTGENVRVVNPASTDPIYYGWNIYYGLTENSPDDIVEERLDTIARSLIPTTDKSAAVFDDTARNIYVGAMLASFYTEAMSCDFMAGMNRLMALPLQDLIAEILSNEKLIIQHPRIRNILQSYADDDSEMLQDAQNTMRAKLRIFNKTSINVLFKGNPKKASPEDLVHGNNGQGTSIYLSIADNLLREYRTIFNLITTQVIKYLGSIPEWERADKDVPIIWLMIDEAGSIGAIDGLADDVLPRFRSRKICCWLCCQGLSQLDDPVNGYSTEGRRKIMDNVETILVLGGGKDKVADDLFSSMSGYYRETKNSNSMTGLNIGNQSYSVSTEYRPVIDASDLRRLSKQHKILCFTGGDMFCCDSIRYFEIPFMKEESEKIKKRNHEIMGD